jgi:hypothetical protein
MEDVLNNVGVGSFEELVQEIESQQRELQALEQDGLGDSKSAIAYKSIVKEMIFAKAQCTAFLEKQDIVVEVQRILKKSGYESIEKLKEANKERKDKLMNFIKKGMGSCLIALSHEQFVKDTDEALSRIILTQNKAAFRPPAAVPIKKEPGLSREECEPAARISPPLQEVRRSPPRHEANSPWPRQSTSNRDRVPDRALTVSRKVVVTAESASHDPDLNFGSATSRVNSRSDRNEQSISSGQNDYINLLFLLAEFIFQNVRSGESFRLAQLGSFYRLHPSAAAAVHVYGGIISFCERSRGAIICYSNSGYVMNLLSVRLPLLLRLHVEGVGGKMAANDIKDFYIRFHDSLDIVRSIVGAGRGVRGQCSRSNGTLIWEAHTGQRDIGHGYAICVSAAETASSTGSGSASASRSASKRQRDESPECRRIAPYVHSDDDRRKDKFLQILFALADFIYDRTDNGSDFGVGMFSEMYKWNQSAAVSIRDEFDGLYSFCKQSQGAIAYNFGTVRPKTEASLSVCIPMLLRFHVAEMGGKMAGAEMKMFFKQRFSSRSQLKVRHTVQSVHNLVGICKASEGRLEWQPSIDDQEIGWGFVVCSTN